MIALIGAFGSIGRRYGAILQYLNEPYKIIEAGDSYDFLQGCTHAIIATPTHTHFEVMLECHNRGVQFLCEKPMSKYPREIKEMISLEAKGFCVNNYSFLSVNEEGRRPSHIAWDFFNSGRDGLVWDVCQLVMLADIYECPLSIKRESYTWTLEWGDEYVDYRDIENSYLKMIMAFLRNDHSNLWGLQEALRMTELCLDIEKELSLGGPYEGFNWRPGPEPVQKITRKNISDDRGEIPLEMGV